VFYILVKATIISNKMIEKGYYPTMRRTTRRWCFSTKVAILVVANHKLGRACQLPNFPVSDRTIGAAKEHRGYRKKTCKFTLKKIR
jgi:hypothetical protein